MERKITGRIDQVVSCPMGGEFFKLGRTTSSYQRKQRVVTFAETPLLQRERSHTFNRVSVSSLVHRFSRRCKGLASLGLSQSPTKSSSKTSSELPNQDKRLWVSTKLDAGWTGFPPYLVPRKNDKPPVPRSITWCRSPRPRAKVRTHPHSFSWPSSQ